MEHVLVFGGTGAMGRHIVSRLLSTTDSIITVPTSDPRADHALALAARDPQRIRLVASATTYQLLHDVDAVFANTNFFAGGSVLAEYHQGLELLSAARAAGVARFVWSSLDSAAALTGKPVPHFDSKAAVTAHINLMRAEEVLRQDEDGWYTEHVSVLTTAPYYENVRDRVKPVVGDDGVHRYRFPLGAARWPLIALADIAWFAVHLLTQWQSWGARDLAVIGDSLSGDDIAATIERVTGERSVYEHVPVTEFDAINPHFAHDYAAMFGFFADRDVYRLDRDVPLLRRLHPGLMTFEDWLTREGSALEGGA